MKIKLTIVALALCTGLFAQKKKNGTIYIEHPAIDVVNQMYEAVNTKDSLKLASLIADDFKGYSGDEMNKDAEAATKEEFLQNVSAWQTYNRYFTINQSDNGYPDAVEYKDETFSSVTWVYAWEKMTGIGGTTGVKFNQPRHVQYGVTDKNQIVFVRIYQNQRPFTESWRSQRELKDGQIYSHHPNINTVSNELLVALPKAPLIQSNKKLSSYSKWPNIQLITISFGQLIHISGLALAGGYGVLRKNPDGEIALSAKVYMGMLGGGGLIAIIGGLMFVYICATRLYSFRYL